MEILPVASLQLAIAQMLMFDSMMGGTIQLGVPACIVHSYTTIGYHWDDAL